MLASLNDDDFNHILDLMDYADPTEQNGDFEIDGDELDIWISDITIAKVQYGTKCFEVHYMTRRVITFPIE